MLINVKATKIENSENGLLGLATVSFGDMLKVQSIAIKAGKEGQPFVAMPSYKTKQVDEEGKAVYKDICNPITKDFRETLYGAIMSAYTNDREATIGDPNGPVKPEIEVRVTPLHNGSSTKALATLYVDDSFVISNVALKQNKDGKLFMAMPSYKTNQVDEEGKAVYKDIAYPANKEARKELQEKVIEGYYEELADVMKPAPEQSAPEPSVGDGFASMGDEELPFADGKEPETVSDKKDTKTNSSKDTKASSQKKDDKGKAKPSIKDRLADGEAKKEAKLAEKAGEVKVPKNQEIA